MHNERFWFTTREAAEYAGRHPVTVRRACEAGELHGTQRTPGRSTWRIHLDCLEAWLLAVPCPHDATGSGDGGNGSTPPGHATEGWPA